MSRSRSPVQPAVPPAEPVVPPAERVARGPRLSFLGNVNAVFLTYLANAALALAVAVLVARALGPEGRGVYGIFMLSASITQAVLSLGIGVSAVYHLGKGAYPPARVVANGQQAMLLSLLVSGALVVIAWPVFGGWFADHDVPYWAFVFVVPLFVNYNTFIAIFQGTSRFLSMNAVILAQPFVQVVLLAAGVLLADVDTTAAVVFWAGGALAAMVLAFALLGPGGFALRQLVSIDRQSLGEQVRFGLQGQVGNLVQLLNYRLDQYLVLLLVNAAGVGIYAVSVSVSQSIWFLSNAVAAVLLPRLTSSDEAEAARLTPLICRNTLLVSTLGAVAIGVASPWLLEPVFGEDFGPSLEPLLLLLPGTVLLAGSKILTSYIFSQGRPLTNSLITVASLLVTLAADFALIPPFGVAGAAVASSLAYAAHFALSLLAYRRLSGGSIWEAVLVRREDLRRYLDVARQRAATA